MAKRLNTRFVSILSTIIVGVFLFGLFGPSLLHRFTRPNNEQKVATLREEAISMVKQGRYAEARDVITNAWLLDRTNKVLCVERGDILARLTQEEGQTVMEQARASWETALEIDANYKVAAERLLDSYVDQMEVAPTAQVCQHLSTAAQRLLKIDPSSERGKTFFNVATVQEWVLGAPKTEEEVNQALVSLDEIRKKYPNDSETLFYLIRGKTNKALEAYRANRFDTAAQLMAESRTDLDQAVTHYPKEAALNFRAFQGYVMLCDIGHDLALIAKDRASADAALLRARTEVKEDDARYPDFQKVAADWAKRNNRIAEAEKILRTFYERHKTDQRARLALARLLADMDDPAKHDEAIAILDQPIELIQASGPRADSIRELESQTLLDLTTLRISKYPLTDLEKRPALLKKIEDAYDKLSGLARPDAIPVLRLKGLICKIKGENVEAVEALSRAMTVLEHGDGKNPMRWDVMFQLAEAEALAGQNHAAEKLLAQIVDKFDAYKPARMRLADLYLQENDLSDAAHHIDVLAQQDPRSLEVVRMQVVLYQRSGQPKEARKYYDTLPETTAEQKVSKAQVASLLGNLDELTRLLTIMQKDRPDDVGVTVALVQAFARADKRDKARQVLASALASHPAEQRYQLLLQELDSTTPVDNRELDELSKDPFSKEIVYARRSLNDSDYAGALEHARAADRLRADDPAAWDIYFQVYLRKQNWAKVSDCIANLSRLNADHAEGRLYRWTMAMNRGQYSDAIAVGRELTSFRDNFGQSWILLAQAYQRNGQYHEALQNYQAALERQTTNIEAYIGIYQCYLALSQPERAADAIEQGRRMFPDSVALRELALQNLARTEPGKVVTLRKAILDKNPDDPDNYTAFSQACVAAAQRAFAIDPTRARAFLDDARDVLGRGVGKFPDSLALNAALAQSLLATNQYADGDKVLIDLGERPKWKNKPDVGRLRADYYARANQPIAAEKAYREAWDKTAKKNVDIELDLATFLSQQGKFTEALEVLKANASDIRVVKQTLQTHIAANHTDIAKKGLEDALRQSPDNPDLLNLLAVVYIDGYRYPEARQAVARVLKLSPDNEIGLYYEALTELRDPIAGDLEIAKRDLGTIVTRNPRNIQYKLEYVGCLLQLKDMDSAAGELEDALKIEPLNRAVRLKLLSVYQQTKKWAAFDKTVQFAELNPAVSEGIWFRQHAYELSAQERFAEAQEKIDEAIAMEPRNPTFARDKLVIFLQAHDAEAVFRETDRLLDAGHREWWLYHSRGVALAIKGKIADALEQFDKAMAAADTENDPDAWQQVLMSLADVSIDDALKRVATKLNDSDRWRLQSASLHMRKEQWDLALADLAPTLAHRDKLLRSDRLSAVRFAAECHQSAGRGLESRKYYDEWLAEAPSDPIALNNVANLIADDLHDPDAASVYSEKAYEAGRKFNNPDPMITDTHGWVLTLCGGDRADQGLSLLSGVVDANPDFLDARYHLAMAFLKKNRGADALRQLTTAMDQIKANEDKKLPVRPQLKVQIQTALDKAKSMAGGV